MGHHGVVKSSEIKDAQANAGILSGRISLDLKRN